MPELEARLHGLLGALVHAPTDYPILHVLHDPSGISAVILPLGPVNAALVESVLPPLPITACAYYTPGTMEYAGAGVPQLARTVIVVGLDVETTVKVRTDPESGWQPMNEPTGDWFDRLTFALMSIIHAHNTKEN